MKNATRLMKTLAACVSAVFFAAAVVGTANATDADQTAGIFPAAPGVGHNMRDPNEFRDDIWKPIVTHMRVRAGLTGQEARDILEFLQRSN